MIACYQIGIQLTPLMGSTIFKGQNAANINAPETIAYQKGVSWAMLCNVVSWAIQFVWRFFQSKVCDKIGLKWVFLVLMVLVGVMYHMFFFVKNKIVYLFIHVPIGFAVVTYNAIPPAVVSLISAPEKLGANLALLNCFNVIGQQISNFGFGMGIGQIWPDKPGNLIGKSCIFAFISAIICFGIVVPNTGQVNKKEIDDSNSDEIFFFFQLKNILLSSSQS